MTREWGAGGNEVGDFVFGPSGVITPAFPDLTFFMSSDLCDFFDSPVAPPGFEAFDFSGTLYNPTFSTLIFANLHQAPRTTNIVSIGYRMGRSVIADHFPIEMTSDALVLELYADDGGGAPGSLLASGSKPVTAIDPGPFNILAGDLNEIVFDPPVPCAEGARFWAVARTVNAVQWPRFRLSGGAPVYYGDPVWNDFGTVTPFLNFYQFAGEPGSLITDAVVSYQGKGPSQLEAIHPRFIKDNAGNDHATAPTWYGVYGPILGYGDLPRRGRSFAQIIG